MQRIRRVVDGYRHGFYTLMETLSAVVSEINETNVGDVVQSLPPGLLAELRQKVKKSPISDEDWSDTIFIDPALRHTESDSERARRELEQKNRYRSGIEALRHFFATDYGPRTND